MSLTFDSARLPNPHTTEEHEAWRTQLRRFIDTEITPYAEEWDEAGHIPIELWPKAAAVGLLGLGYPEEYGGTREGIDSWHGWITNEELARIGVGGISASLMVHGIGLPPVLNWGTEAMKQMVAPPVLAGDKHISLGITEPGAGSDAGSLRTSAVLDGDHYVVNGSKVFISGAGETDVLVVMTRTGDAGPKGVTALLIPADADGVGYGKKEDKMGWNAQPTRMVTFDNVRVPVTNRLGNEGQGFAIAMEGLDGGRINIATCSIGTAQQALEEATAYVQERKQFGSSIADFQATQFKLADMLTELVAARQMVRLAASKLDKGDPQATTYCAMAKRFATDVGFKVCNDALQLFGGYGYIKEYPLERHVRDTRVHQILEGTNEIMRVIVSRRLLMDGALEVIK